MQYARLIGTVQLIGSREYKETVVIDDFFLHKDFDTVSKKKQNKIEL